MELIKFIMWLITEAVIGWVASSTVTAEHGRIHMPMPLKGSSSDKS